MKKANYSDCVSEITLTGSVLSHKFIIFVDVYRAEKILYNNNWVNEGANS